MSSNMNGTYDTYIDDVYKEYGSKMRNHSDRRKFLRTVLRNQKFFIDGNLGKKNASNNLREMHRLERNPYTWFSRVMRSQEEGRLLHKENTERDYESLLDQEDVRQQKRLATLIEFYGDEKTAIKMHDEELDKLAQKFEKKSI